MLSGWVNTTSLSLAANFQFPEGMYVFYLLVTPAMRQLFGKSSCEIDLSKTSHFSLITISKASISVS